MADLEVTTEARELAGKTAAEIRRRGWMQDYYYDRDAADIQNCRVCVLGGVLAVTAGAPDQWESVHQIPLVKVLHARSGGNVAEWNDTEGRTEGEVLALLDSIAAGQ